MTHWKQLFNPNYIGAYDFAPDEERTLIITKVASELVQSPDGEKESCIVAHFKEGKPMILNKTNCKIISKLYGTPMIEDWTGKRITLVVRKVKAFGEVTDALRIKEQRPELPELYPTHEKWEGAVQALKAGQVTIEAIKKNYKLSKQSENELTESVQN
jgi:hypothetical protein